MARGVSGVAGEVDGSCGEVCNWGGISKVCTMNTDTTRRSDLMGTSQTKSEASCCFGR